MLSVSGFAFAKKQLEIKTALKIKFFIILLLTISDSVHPIDAKNFDLFHCLRDINDSLTLIPEGC